MASRGAKTSNPFFIHCSRKGAVRDLVSSQPFGHRVRMDHERASLELVFTVTLTTNGNVRLVVPSGVGHECV